MKIYKCKCGEHVPGDEAPKTCRCGDPRFEEFGEIRAPEPDTKATPLTMPDFSAMIRDGVFPGQGEPKKGETGVARFDRWLRSIIQADAVGARKAVQDSLDANPENPFAENIRTVMNVTTGSTGQYTVPVEFVERVFFWAEKYGVARRDCLTIPMARTTKDISMVAAGITAYRVTEGAAITQSEPTFGQTVLSAAVIAALSVGTIQFWEDSLADMELIAMLAGEAIAYKEDYDLFNLATYGLLTHASVTSKTMAAGNTAFTNIVADDIFDLSDQLSDSESDGAQIYLHKNILTMLRKQKDNNGSYILIPANNGMPATLCGENYTKSAVMPGSGDSAANTAFIVYGNLKKTVAFGNRKELTVDWLTEATVGSDNLGEKLMRGLRFYERIDIKPFYPAKIARLKTAAT
jgi:HK97 family phage major capsid protein